MHHLDDRALVPFPGTSIEDLRQVSTSQIEEHRDTEDVELSVDDVQHPAVRYPKHLDHFRRPVDLTHLLRPQLPGCFCSIAPKRVAKLETSERFFALLPERSLSLFADSNRKV